MAASGLLAILDDIGAMLDDGSSLEEIGAEKATKLAHGGLIDDIKEAHDKKVNVDHRHEMAVVMQVAKGALKNKLLYFIPTTFAIAAFAPWAVMPLCIGSGAYIAYEGMKRLETRRNPEAHARHQQELMKATLGGKETLLRYEKEKISQAIKTDAALSLELTGFQVGVAAAAPLAVKLAVISAISIGATAALYTTVMGIIGMNYLAHKLANKEGKSRGARSKRALGRGLRGVSAPMMKGIALVGMAALFFVGGHLLAAYIPGVPEALAATGKAIVSATAPWVAGPLGVAMDISTGLVGGIISYAGVKSVKGVHGFLKRRENGIYSSATKKLKSGLSRKGLCKAFSKVSGIKCKEEPALKENLLAELIVLDQNKKQPVRRRRASRQKKALQRRKHAQQKKAATPALAETPVPAQPVEKPAALPEPLTETFTEAVEKPAVNDNDMAVQPVRPKQARGGQGLDKKSP